MVGGLFEPNSSLSAKTYSDGPLRDDEIEAGIGCKRNRSLGTFTKIAYLQV